MPSDHLDAEHSSSFDPQQGQREETHVAFLPGKKEGIRDHRGLAFLLTLVALVPVIVVIFQRTGHSYLPAADQALIDLRVRDVFSFSSNTPFLGPYSRFGWNHPGALLYYLLAVINWPLGNPAWGLLLGVALLEGIALTWTARLAWVFGGLKTLIPWVAVVSLSCLAVGPNVLEVIWGPNILLPFFVLFLLQCWVILCGDSRRLLGLVFVGTLLIQTHVGYAVPVIVLSLASVTWLYIGIKKNWIVHHARLTCRAPLILFVVLWFPPLVLDPLFHSRLNFVQIISSSNGGSTLELHGALGYMAAEFHWVPPWLGGADVINPFLGTAYTQPLIWLLIPISLLAISGWAAFTKKESEINHTYHHVVCGFWCQYLDAQPGHRFCVALSFLLAHCGGGITGDPSPLGAHASGPTKIFPLDESWIPRRPLVQHSHCQFCSNQSNPERKWPHHTSFASCTGSHLPIDQSRLPQGSHSYSLCRVNSFGLVGRCL